MRKELSINKISGGKPLAEMIVDESNERVP